MVLPIAYAGQQVEVDAQELPRKHTPTERMPVLPRAELSASSMLASAHKKAQRAVGFEEQAKKLKLVANTKR